jgi:sec-independent protein translocase protein TatB
MFDIGWSELLIIGVVALIAIGPKELPGVLRTVGQYMGKVRRMAAEFQSQFNEAMREAEMADIKKEVDDLANTASSVTSFDPIGEMNREVQTAFEGKPAADAPPAEVPSADAPPAAESFAPAEATVAQDNVKDNVQANVSPPPAEPETAGAPQPKAGSGA